MSGATTTMTYPPAARRGDPHPAGQDPHATRECPAARHGRADEAPAHPPGTPQPDHDDPAGADTWWQQRYTPPAPPTRLAAALPDLRNRVVNALVMANFSHAQQAWARRRRDPLNPHALLFLYAEPPAGDPPRCELRLACRLFLGADEPHLPLLLYEFADRVAEHLRNGEDPRGPQLSNTVQDMSPRARYLGLAASSLDTAEGTWTTVQRIAGSDLDIPGRCYAVLLDGSRIRLDRHARDRYGRVDVLSTHPIRDHSGQAERRWALDHRGQLTGDGQQDDDARHTWAWLGHVHDLITRFRPSAR